MSPGGQVPVITCLAAPVSASTSWMPLSAMLETKMRSLDDREVVERGLELRDHRFAPVLDRPAQLASLGVDGEEVSLGRN